MQKYDKLTKHVENMPPFSKLTSYDIATSSPSFGIYLRYPKEILAWVKNAVLNSGLFFLRSIVWVLTSREGQAIIILNVGYVRPIYNNIVRVSSGGPLTLIACTSTSFDFGSLLHIC